MYNICINIRHPWINCSDSRDPFNIYCGIRKLYNRCGLLVRSFRMLSSRKRQRHCCTKILSDSFLFFYYPKCTHARERESRRRLRCKHIRADCTDLLWPTFTSFSHFFFILHFHNTSRHETILVSSHLSTLRSLTPMHILLVTSLVCHVHIARGNASV